MIMRSPPRVPIMPSAETASLSVTCGRPLVIRWMWPEWARAASSASTPVVTAMPAASSTAWPLPCVRGSGSTMADDDARDPGLDQRLAARLDAALVGAGLQRDIDRGAFGRRTGVLQRLLLGMRPPADRRPAAADDHRRVAVGPDDDAADRRVGLGLAEIAPAEAQRRRHHAPVEFGIDAGGERLGTGAAWQASLLVHGRRLRRKARRAPS